MDMKAPTFTNTETQATDALERIISILSGTEKDRPGRALAMAHKALSSIRKPLPVAKRLLITSSALSSVNSELWSLLHEQESVARHDTAHILENVLKVDAILTEGDPNNDAL